MGFFLPHERFTRSQYHCFLHSAYQRSQIRFPGRDGIELSKNFSVIMVIIMSRPFLFPKLIIWFVLQILPWAFFELLSSYMSLRKRRIQHKFSPVKWHLLFIVFKIAFYFLVTGFLAPRGKILLLFSLFTLRVVRVPFLIGGTNSIIICEHYYIHSPFTLKFWR